MSCPKPTVTIAQVSWSLPCAEFSAKDNWTGSHTTLPYFSYAAFWGYIETISSPRSRRIMPAQFCCWWKQPVLLQGSLQQPPKESQPPLVVALSSPSPSSVPPTTTLLQPKPHHYPTRRASSHSALSLEAATSRSATIAETPRGSSLGRWQGAEKFDWLWVHRKCLLLDN